MRIGILQAGQAPGVLKDEAGDYDEMFEKLLAGRGFTFETFHVEGLEFPENAEAADGWLITGSRHGAYEDHDFIPKLEDLIREAFAKDIPVVGICFGHQIIAQALGGKVEKFSGGWAVGPTDYDMDGERIKLNAWHQDQVTVRPEGAEVIGSNAFCENAMLVYGKKAFTIQAHPEYNDDFISGLIRTRGRGKVPDPLLEDAEARMGHPNASG